MEGPPSTSMDTEQENIPNNSIMETREFKPKVHSKSEETSQISESAQRAKKRGRPPLTSANNSSNKKANISLAASNRKKDSEAETTWLAKSKGTSSISHVKASLKSTDTPQAKKRGRPPLLRTSTPPPQTVTNGKGLSNERTSDAMKECEPVYNMMLPKKNLVDKKIDEEVKSRFNETPEDAFKQVLKDVSVANKKGIDDEWKIDFIVASTEHKKKVVIKYSGYATPSIVKIMRGFIPSTPEYIDYWRRHEAMNDVEKYLRMKMGTAMFDDRYPFRFVPNEEGATESAFVTNVVTKYKNLVRSLEWRHSFEADQVNQPFVYYEDWTGETTGPLPLFNYTNVLIPSKRVKRALSKSKEFYSYRCKEDVCGTGEGQSCDSFLLNRKDKDHRKCGCKLMKKGRNDTVIDKSPVECTDMCECDPEQCGNRVIQKGRQIGLLIFREWRKNWTCLAATIIKKGDFIGEYTGEVITTNESERREEHSYYMEMPNVRAIEDPDMKNGKKTHKKLIIDGFKYGNETRFISHSCEPNLELVNAYVERAGGWFCRMVFVAKKDIETGEELTFDYFPKVKYDEKQGHYNNLFPDCECGSKRCKFVGPLSDANKKLKEEAFNGSLQRKMKEKAEQEEDSWSESSENECDDKKTERQKKSKLARGERNDRRAIMKENNHQQMFDELLAKAIEDSETRGEERRETSGDEEQEVMEM